MNTENQPGAPGLEATEPKAGRAVVPVWLFLVFFMLLYWGMIYFDEQSAWAAPQVYIPYHSAAELALYQPRVDGPDIHRGPRLVEGELRLICDEPFWRHGIFAGRPRPHACPRQT